MNRIKILREELNMTQQELADKLDGAKSTVAMYEKGDRKPSMEVLLKLSEIFNCSIDYLLGKSDIRNPINIDENKINLAFSSGYNGLNETNKNIINATIAGLLAKQKSDETEKKEKSKEKKDEKKQ